MLNWTAGLNRAWRRNRLLLLGLVTVALVPGLAEPSGIARSAAGLDVAGNEAGRSSQWIERPPLRHARGGLGVAKVGGQILAIGGFDEVDVFDVVEARRVAGVGRWRDLAPMQTARANFATAVLHELVYVVGGLNEEADLDVVETYNPRSGRWATSVPLPQWRVGAGAAALGGLLYVAGGEIPLGVDDLEVTNSVVVYNPKKKTWTSVAPVPTARTRLRLVASGRYLYAIGGRDPSGQPLTAVERYDPRSNSWRTLSPMHESRLLPCVVETRVGERRVLVVVAGGGSTFGRRTTEVFDPDTGRWTLLDVLLPHDRVSHDCATEADGTVLAIGGITPISGAPTFLANVDALSLKPRDLR